ncbi:helix-turn-helix transcriptional regulator [Parablautia muri]|uniref:AraC family transcriptional regulator n=1 Tax=Parablautia muri TaxID=2320879 RepID=A0A9X5BDL3_9FIRM|nr:AraC family transcriptional regulator [Parablautia muri]NBJ91836.1 AraC family transcriptional regulator [Parablautia muri]
MNLKVSFLSSLTTPPKLAPSHAPEEFLGQVPDQEIPSPSPLLYLLSSGTIKAAFPWTFDIAPMDCYLFLYTKKGCGKLTVNHQIFSLNGSSLLFLDCHQKIHFDIAASPWEYQVFFCSGDNFSYYSRLIPTSAPLLMQITRFSETALCLELLLSVPSPYSFRRQLTISDLLNRIITQFIISLLEEPETLSQIPAYIKNMKDLFDNHFNEPYHLDGLEKLFGISKYRLCHEFTSIYHISPIQYLNKKRIEHGAHLLLVTNYRVHEIGNMVGIENTNHFIALFKKYYGTTPLEYKRHVNL